MITSYEVRLIREKEKRRILDELDIGGNISANDMIVKQYKEIERLKKENEELKHKLKLKNSYVYGCDIDSLGSDKE